MLDGKLTAETLSYSIPGAVAASGLSRSTLYNLVNAGKLRIVRIGRRSVIPASDLRRLVEGEAA